MQTPATDATGPRSRRAGFTLIELLVALFIFAVIGQSLVVFFASSSKLRSVGEIRLETHQAMMATMDSLAREIRLAGACFPTNGRFVALAAVDNARQDQITVRLGRTNNQTCLQQTLRTNAAAGGQTLDLTVATDFEVDTAGYVTNGSNGDFFRITGVSGNVVTTDATWSRNYASGVGGAAVYAMHERAYALCAAGTCPDGRTGPALTMSDDRGPVHVFADGVTDLNIRYQKVDNSIVDVPVDDAAWRLVKESLIEVSARSLDTLPGGGFHTEAGAISVKPRNLQP